MQPHTNSALLNRTNTHTLTEPGQSTRVPSPPARKNKPSLKTLHLTFHWPFLPSNPSVICVIIKPFLPFIKTTRHSYSQTHPCPPGFPESTRILWNVIHARPCLNHLTSLPNLAYLICLCRGRRVNTNKQMGQLAEKSNEGEIFLVSWIS